ncbi:MAG: hypothetical protein NVSMB18_00960 [Acetobacteraceae bacterium]
MVPWLLLGRRTSGPEGYAESDRLRQDAGGPKPAPGWHRLTLSVVDGVHAIRSRGADNNREARARAAKCVSAWTVPPYYGIGNDACGRPDCRRKAGTPDGAGRHGA